MGTPLTATTGIYVIEVSHGVIKIGMSADTDRRISTHLRNARGLGADPYRHAVVECPSELLREAEKAAHAAARAIGGTAQARTPEVFCDVFYNPALAAVRVAVTGVIEHAEALARLRALDDRHLDSLLTGSHPDVATVTRRAVRA